MRWRGMVFLLSACVIVYLVVQLVSLSLFDVRVGEKRVVYGYVDRIYIGNIIQEAKMSGSNGLEILEEGILLYPMSDELFYQRGSYFYVMGDYVRSCMDFDRASYLNPGEDLYLESLSNCFRLLKDYKISSQIQLKLYEKNKDDYNFIQYVFFLWMYSDFSDYYFHQNRIIEITKSQLLKSIKPDLNPYQALHLPFSLSDYYRIVELYSPSSNRKFTHIFNQKKRIKIGYVSSDLREHAVGLQFQGVFHYHDPKEFEIYVFMNFDMSKLQHDRIFNNIKDKIEHVMDVSALNDDEMSDTIYNLQIDILFDLNLFTEGNRMGVFSKRPAPIQIAGIGFSGTTGSQNYDYIVADSFVVSEVSKKYFSENLIMMPHSYHPFSHKLFYKIPQKLRGNEDQYYLCNLANPLRITIEELSNWAVLLKRNDTLLVLKYVSVDHEEEIQKFFRENDIQKEKLIFMKGGDLFDHIGQKTICDIYLDTHQYNGHSTTADILWSGVPMVTYPGDSMASRAAASFITSAGFSDLIVNSWRLYIEKVTYLLNNPTQLNTLRIKVEQSRNANDLFNLEQWVQNLESAYREVYNLYKTGQPFKTIQINPN